nr:MAG TPA: hypothetical protein [Caudoviricetes sp.]
MYLLLSKIFDISAYLLCSITLYLHLKQLTINQSFQFSYIQNYSRRVMLIPALHPLMYQ